MNDKELADKVVALGVGSISIRDGADEYKLPDGCFVRAGDFIRDGRVVLAMMERLGQELVIWKILYEDEDLDGGELISLQTGHAWVVEPEKIDAACQNESLPRAILEACVKALEQANEQ
jgi:hypothetical protein